MKYVVLCLFNNPVCTSWVVLATDILRLAYVG